MYNVQVYRRPHNQTLYVQKYNFKIIEISCHLRSIPNIVSTANLSATDEYFLF